MIFHRSINSILILLTGIAFIDIFIHNLWAIALYLILWVAILLRKPDRKTPKDEITSPVSGRIIRIITQEIDGERMQVIRIMTNPIVDTQTFRLVPNQNIKSFTTSVGSVIVEYESGIIVKHRPYNRLSHVFDIYRDQILDGVYGNTFFGCITTLTLPKGIASELIEGQKVLDGETVIARK